MIIKYILFPLSCCPTAHGVTCAAGFAATESTP
jgi:hypothetical protein